jgi:hypothetical protein
MSRYGAFSGTCDQIFLSVRRLFSEIYCLAFLGRPLWREVGSVICLSLSSNFPLFTSNIYITCVLQFSNLCTININLQSARLSTANYALLVILAQTSCRSQVKSKSKLLYDWPCPLTSPGTTRTENTSDSFILRHIDRSSKRTPLRTFLLLLRSLGVYLATVVCRTITLATLLYSCLFRRHYTATDDVSQYLQRRYILIYVRLQPTTLDFASLILLFWKLLLSA